MAGMFVHFGIDASDFLRFRREALSFASIFSGDEWARELLQDVGEYVLDRVMLQFKDEGKEFLSDPADPWAQLSESRQRQRADHDLHPQHPILIAETQKLINSWQWDWLDEHSVLIGMWGMGSGPDSMDHYGAWNTFGVEERNLPARPMLVVDDDMVDTINQMFEDAFDSQWIHFFGPGANLAGAPGVP